MKNCEIELKETTDGDLFFNIPDDTLDRLGWQEGDDLKFEEKNGAIFIKKIKHENIELEFNDEELLKYMIFAHERGITFNQLCEDAINAKLNENEGTNN